jgi:hypothetical protein
MTTGTTCRDGKPGCRCLATPAEPTCRCCREPTRRQQMRESPSATTRTLGRVLSLLPERHDLELEAE